MIIKNNLPLYKTETNEKLTKKEEKEYQKIKEEIIQLKINDKNLNVETKEIKELMIEKSINSQKIIDKLTNDLKGYGKIDSLLKDDELEKINQYKFIIEKKE